MGTRTPTHYTSSEGGSWIPWRAGEIDMGYLNTIQPQLNLVNCNGIRFHSLAFGNPTADRSTWDRWDCINQMN